MIGVGLPDAYSVDNYITPNTSIYYWTWSGWDSNPSGLQTQHVLAKLVAGTGNFTNAGSITAGNGFYGDGSGLTNLQASAVTGTLPLATLPNQVLTNGSSLNAANLTNNESTPFTTYETLGSTTPAAIGSGIYYSAIYNPFAGVSAANDYATRSLSGFTGSITVSAIGLQSSTVSLGANTNLSVYLVIGGTNYYCGTMNGNSGSYNPMVFTNFAAVNWYSVTATSTISMGLSNTAGSTGNFRTTFLISKRYNH
jgi:hypothetical protein